MVIIDITGLAKSLKRVLSIIDEVSSYVDDVVAGKRAPDRRIGRDIADVIAAMPRVRPDVFQEQFNKNLQDLLMVVYMSNLTRAHVAITEKLKLGQK